MATTWGRQSANITNIQYIANRTGDSTEPCLTPKVTVNIEEKKSSHLTH